MLLIEILHLLVSRAPNFFSYYDGIKFNLPPMVSRYRELNVTIKHKFTSLGTNGTVENGNQTIQCILNIMVMKDLFLAKSFPMKFVWIEKWEEFIIFLVFFSSVLWSSNYISLCFMIRFSNLYKGISHRTFFKKLAWQSQLNCFTACCNVASYDFDDGIVWWINYRHIRFMI